MLYLAGKIYKVKLEIKYFFIIWFPVTVEVLSFLPYFMPCVFYSKQIMPGHLGAWRGITFPSTPFPMWVARGLNCQQDVSTADVKMLLASFLSLALNFDPLPFLPAGTVMTRTNMAAMHFFNGNDAVSQSSWVTTQLPSNMEHSPQPTGERQQAT